jgi:hypothetical protein
VITKNYDDGDEPAFPQVGFNGLTIRDYFAAHAPRRPYVWFEPKMRPRPKPHYDHDHPNERKYEERLIGCTPVNELELAEYDDERHRQILLQWPYFYADAIIAERAK